MHKIKRCLCSIDMQVLRTIFYPELSLVVKRPFGAAKRPFDAVKRPFGAAKRPFDAVKRQFDAVKRQFGAAKCTRLLSCAQRLIRDTYCRHPLSFRHLPLL
jgi:hypothetical protein